MRILIARRCDTTPRLAAELGVSERTIRRDVLSLTADHPLETQRGNGGCVKVADWYHPHRNLLSKEQQQVLCQLMEAGDAHQAKVLGEMLVEYGSPQCRKKYE